ncbi:hypothetical protein KSS87_010115 [Heliosperma pusillum]|nr:hypothetical protein KSS87_010115 [Heliosperma pusillum]
MTSSSSASSLKALSKIACNRLQKELMEWQTNPPVGFKHKVTDNLQRYPVRLMVPSYDSELYLHQHSLNAFKLYSEGMCFAASDILGTLAHRLRCCCVAERSQVQVLGAASCQNCKGRLTHITPLWWGTLPRTLALRERPEDNDRYVKNCRNGRSPKETRWWFHDDKAYKNKKAKGLLTTGPISRTTQRPANHVEVGSNNQDTEYFPVSQFNHVPVMTDCSVPNVSTPQVSSELVQVFECCHPCNEIQHEKEALNQAGMLPQSNFEHVQKTVIPDPKGLDKFHLSGQSDILVQSLIYDLPEAGNSSSSVSATVPEELNSLLNHKTMAGSGGTKNADETTSRGGNNVASNNLNCVQGEISSNCFLGNGPQNSASFNLTEIAEEMGNDGLEEVDSFGSEAALVSVGGYKVKPKYEFPLGVLVLRSSSEENKRHAELKAQVKQRGQELEDYKRVLAIQKVVLQDLEKAICAAEHDIVAMKEGVTQVEKMISENKAKLRHFVKLGSLGQGLI